MSLQLVHRQREPAPRKMMQMKKCCCRYDLRTGSFVVGIITAVCALGALMGDLAWAYASAWRSWADGQRWAQSARTLGFQEDFVQAGLRQDFSALTFSSSRTIHVLLHLLGVVEAFHFNFSLMLLYGIWKKRRAFLRLWVKVSIIAMAARVLFIMPIAVEVLAQDYVALGVSVLVLATASIVLVVYFVLVVYNYLIQLKSEKLLRIYDRDWADVR